MDDPRVYLRLAAIIRQQIVEGHIQPGDPTPTITELTKMYGHARPTCAHALHQLEQEGFITRFPGHGYVVTSSTPAGGEMLVIKVTDQATLKEFNLKHEIKNRGKITEEHHFYLELPGADVPRAHFVTGRDEARELRAHL